MQKQSSLKNTGAYARWRAPMLVVVAVAVCAICYAAYANKTNGQVKKTELTIADKELVFELAAADVARAEVRELSSKLPVSGSLVPESQVTIRAKVVAEVAEAPVQEGVAVRKGQIIARFTAADLHARLLTQDAAVDEAQARLALAQKNRQSNEVLLKQNYISQNAFDTTHNGVELAQANLKSALSQKQVAQLAVADTEIHAPMDGVISKRFVQPGEKVSPDSALYSIVNLGRMILEAQVPANEIPRVKIGQKVVFLVDGFDGREFQGRVARINPAAEPGSRAMTVYAAVENADFALKGGMFAKGQLVLEKTASAATVPLTAVRQINGADVVFEIVNDQVKMQPVKLGLRSEDEGSVQILEGLSPGAVVIAARLDAVKAGSKVRMPRVNAATKA